MFLGVDREENLATEPLRGQRPLAIALVALGATGLLLLGEVSRWTTGAAPRGRASTPASPTSTCWASPSTPPTCSPSRPPPPCWSSPWSARSSWPGGRRRRSTRPTNRCRGVDAGAGPAGDAASSADGGRRRRAATPADATPPPTTSARPERGRPVTISAGWYLGLSVVLFAIGALGVLIRRNVLVMFMCVELMLNAANLTFVTFARHAARHRRPGAGVLRAGGGGRRSGGRTRASWSPSSAAGPPPPPTTST